MIECENVNKNESHLRGIIAAMRDVIAAQKQELKKFSKESIAQEDEIQRLKAENERLNELLTPKVEEAKP